MLFKKIAIATDHAGMELKQKLLSSSLFGDTLILDYGPALTEFQSKCDYPDIASKLATDVSKGVLEGGIAICGTGIGMSICANKYPRVRAACAWDEFSCKMSREHNDSNILCLGARVLCFQEVLELVKIWLSTPFSNQPRHVNRLKKLENIEQQNFKN